MPSSRVESRLYDPKTATELGLTKEQAIALNADGFRDQIHYSKPVRRALARFQLLYQIYCKPHKYDFEQKKERGVEAEKAWKQLLEARERETGVRYYLNPVQYDQATHALSR